MHFLIVLFYLPNRDVLLRSAPFVVSFFKAREFWGVDFHHNELSCGRFARIGGAVCVHQGGEGWTAEPDARARMRLRLAVWGLKDARPEDSAYRVVTAAQIWVGALFLATCLGFVLVAPGLALNVFVLTMSAANLAIAGFRVYLAVTAPVPEARAAGLRAADPDPTDLPRYSVLVPLYREAEVVPALLRALGALIYPAERIEYFLICEADDAQTLAAARDGAARDHRFRVIAVPPCAPRTKPKALNYALTFATGDCVVVYDAEDRPDADQLLKAARAFSEGPAALACLQARLNWYNRNDNWLTRAFALEYAMWFDYLLPGLERLGAPIPLGGTSNHFKTRALVAAGAWDPFNVTEDADLGLRLMRMGGTVATLDSTTLEEATSTIPAWLKQRSRWIKGYMQTWLVQMRDPVRLWQAAGAPGFAAFQLFVGGVVVTALVNPVLWIVSLGALVFWALDAPGPLVDFGLIPAAVSLLLGNAALIYLNMLCVLRRGWLDLVPAALATPLYWALISCAGYRAAHQLVVNPFYWDKTEHGAGAGAV
jgi:glycosyltransferase XagB